jgi:PAS domain S-box-containing protein
MLQVLSSATRRHLAPFVAAALAVLIFVVDSFTSLGLAVAVFYVFVVLLSGRVLSRGGIVGVSMVCVGLTVLSFAIHLPELENSPSVAQFVASITAVAITTGLVLRARSAADELKWRAELLDVTRDAMFAIDLNDVITSWNRGAVNLYGWRAREAIGKVAASLLRTDLGLPRDAVIRSVLDTGHWDGEAIQTRKDGSRVTIDIRLALKRDSRGKPEAILESDTDITKRVQAEQGLRQSEALLAEAQKLSQTGSFAWSAATQRMVRWSAEMYRIFSCDPGQEPTAELMLQRAHQEDAALTGRLFEEASEAGKNWDFEQRLVMPDGSTRNVRVVAHTVEDPSGTVELVGAVMDVTKAKRAEVEVQRAQATLSHVARLTEMSQLSASIAHEINQPLTAIRTNGEVSLRLLDREVPDLPEVRNALADVVSNAERASAVIQRLRSLFSKAERKVEVLRVSDLINESISLLRRRLDERNARLHVDLASHQLTVSGDSVQLQQVMINLVANGLDASPPTDGMVPEITIRATQREPDEVMIEVVDSGVGLPSGGEERVFEMFYSTKSNGMGMGLGICRSIVERHGGRLWASRNRDKGTTFHLTLPSHHGGAS